jgi:hypothetical protein
MKVALKDNSAIRSSISRTVLGAVLASERCEQNEQHVGRLALVEEREHRRVCRVAAIPVRLAVDVDGRMDLRQTGRREENVSRHLGLAEDAKPAGRDLSGADEELERTACSKCLEIYLSLEDVPQRIHTQRVQLGRREETCPCREHLAGGREPDRLLVSRSHERRRHLLADLRPERSEAVARAGAASLEPSVGEDHGVHGSRAAPAESLDFEPRVFEQPLEHSPGKGAVSTSALEGKVHSAGLAAHGRFDPRSGVNDRYKQWARPAEREGFVMSVVQGGCWEWRS